MKTEISRDSLQREKRYSGVYQQQGRMLTDSDWNELVEILKDRVNEALKDVVGAKQGSIGGTPRHRALRIVADPTDTFKIQPGQVYIDGIAAEVAAGNTDYTAQDDFPSAPATPGADYVLYADVWERTVTQLMDERLRDPGLHGADTCTRKQTLAQIKWCPNTIDPEQSSKNPSRGDAELSLTLSERTTQADDCDPCAAELAVDSKVGNYLFRVEVHDVKGDADGPTEVTLKWSSENGAEQFAAMPTREEMPAGFISDKWVYEFFDEISEKHLGVHLENTAWEPVRGVLTEINESTSPYAVPTISGIADTPVLLRRWDGYCKLDLKTPDLLEGVDRGVVLATGKGEGNLGNVDITSLSAIKIVLDSIDLQLDLDARALVAGDFWLAEVREAVNDPLDPVSSKLIENQTPRGIEHRYLALGEVDAAGLKDNQEAERKYAFPPLTELTRLFHVGGDGQEAMPNHFVPQSLIAGVSNGEWPVAGARIEFTVTRGNGKLEAHPDFPLENFDALDPVTGIATTDGATRNGRANCRWQLGPTDRQQRVTARLVDPDSDPLDADYPRYLEHPPIHFYANLSTADQVAYVNPTCSDSPSVNSLLDTDTDVTWPDHDSDGDITVKDVLDALLCSLKARHVPYNPNETNDTNARWRDILEQPGSGDLAEPSTVQEAIDELIVWLESTDIRYQVPGCGTPTDPTVRSSLGIIPGTHKVDEILDALLCQFKATHLPLDKVGTALCDRLKNDPGVLSVQDAIDALCRTESGGGCAITVGDGGQYQTFKELEDAVMNGDLSKESRLRVCLLRGIDEGVHEVAELKIVGKHSIHISGGGADVYLRGRCELQATNITLDGINFFFYDKETSNARGTGAMSLSSTSGRVTVENCYFYRDFEGDAGNWSPVVTVGEDTSLEWEGNFMAAIRQVGEIVAATIPRVDAMSAGAADAVKDLQLLFDIGSSEEPEAVEARINDAAKKIAALDPAVRDEWFNARFKTRIDRLPNTPVNVSRPGRDPVIRQPIPREPIPGIPPLRTETIRLAQAKATPRDEVRNFYDILNTDGPLQVESVADSLRTVIALKTGFDYALALTTNKVGGWIKNNRIQGYVALHQNQDKAVSLTWPSTVDANRQNNKKSWAVKNLTPNWATSQQIFIESNVIRAVHSMVSAENLDELKRMLDSGAAAITSLEAYESVTVHDNVFDEDNNSWIGKFVSVNGNHFLYRDDKGAILAFVLGFRGMFIGTMSYITDQSDFTDYMIEQITNDYREFPSFIRIV